MNVAAILTRDPVTIPAQASVDDAMELMEEREVRHLPVVEGTHVVGVISDRDLLLATGWLHPAQREMLEAPEGRVGHFMHTPPITVAPAQEIRDVLGAMLEQRVGCLPVLEEGLLVGIVSEFDLLREYAHACTTGQLTQDDDPLVEAFTTRDVLSVAPDASGDEVAAILRKGSVRHLPVLDGGALVGIVSERDVYRARGCGRLELTLVSELMTPDPLTARPDERLSSVARILSSAKVSALPVLEEARLIGIISLPDVLAPCGQALQTLD